MSFSLTEEVIHLPPAPDPDMIGVLFWAEKVRAWALELENGWAEEGEGVGEKGYPYPFIKAVKFMSLPTRLKIRLFPKGRADETVGLPMPVLMRIS